MLERVKNYAVLWVVPEPHFCNSLCKSLFSQSNLTSRRKVKSKWTPWSNGNFHMRSTMNIVACTDLKCQKDTGWDIVMLSCVFYIYIYIIFINFFFSAAGCTYPIEERTKEFSRSTDFQLFWSFSSKTALNTSINQLKSWQKHASSRHGLHLLVTSISHATIRKQYYIWASK